MNNSINSKLTDINTNQATMMESLLGLNARMKTIETKQATAEASNDSRHNEVINSMNLFDQKLKNLDEKVEREKNEIRTEINQIKEIPSQDKEDQNTKMTDT